MELLAVLQPAASNPPTFLLWLSSWFVLSLPHPMFLSIWPSSQLSCHSNRQNYLPPLCIMPVLSITLISLTSTKILLVFAWNVFVCLFACFLIFLVYFLFLLLHSFLVCIKRGYYEFILHLLLIFIGCHLCLPEWFLYK